MSDHSLPKQAMVLAAGLATRMRPLTEDQPKALLEVGGLTVLDHCLDRLKTAGIERVVINLHHHGEKIESHLAQRDDLEFVFLHETELLETGGGIANALEHFGDQAFVTMNAKMILLEGTSSTLQRLGEAWRDAEMDGLLLVHSTVEAYGYRGHGDFMVDPLGKLKFRPEREVAPYVYTGLQILHPRMFAGAPAGKFPLSTLYNQVIEKDRLYGLVHDGEWFLIETPEGLEQANGYMRQRFPGMRHRGR